MDYIVILDKLVKDARVLVSGMRNAVAPDLSLFVHYVTNVSRMVLPGEIKCSVCEHPIAENKDVKYIIESGAGKEKICSDDCLRQYVSEIK